MKKTCILHSYCGAVFVGSAIISSPSYGAKICDHEDPQFSLRKCTASAVCSYATETWAIGKKWSDGYWQRFVQEAKRRGLTCGVGAVKPTPLRTAFITLTKEDRKLVQEVLKEKASIPQKLMAFMGKELQQP